MKQDLKQSKQAIRAFIRAHWSDEKLCAVFAFNLDGKMSYSDSCGCIRGVTLADTLHTEHELHIYHRPGTPREQLMHYSEAGNLPGAWAAEFAYGRLGPYELAQRRLSAILRAEMRRRERLAAPMPEVASAVTHD